MRGKITKESYERLIQQDLEWLKQQPESLERDHIEQIIKYSVKSLYPDTEVQPLPKFYSGSEF